MTNQCCRTATAGSIAAMSMAMLLGGCGDPTMEVRTFYGQGIKSSGLGHTYAWREPDPEQTMGTPEVRQRVREIVEQQLSTRGFAVSPDDGKADFWVICRLARRAKTDSSVNPHGVTVEEGSLVIDVGSPATRKVVWRGIAQARIRDSDPPEVREKRVNEAVRKLMQRFPPA